MSNKLVTHFVTQPALSSVSYCNIWKFLVRVIGLENSLRLQTGANTRKYMQANANKSDYYLHIVACICIYFVAILWQSHHIEGGTFYKSFANLYIRE